MTRSPSCARRTRRRRSVQPLRPSHAESATAARRRRARSRCPNAPQLASPTPRPHRRKRAAAPTRPCRSVARPCPGRTRARAQRCRGWVEARRLVQAARCRRRSPTRSTGRTADAGTAAASSARAARLSTRQRGWMAPASRPAALVSTQRARVVGLPDVLTRLSLYIGPVAIHC